MLHRDVGPEELGAIAHIEETASPASAILAVAEREQCDLIILGETRERVLGPIIEGTVEEVFRKSLVSVLAVRNRPRRPYRHLMVGTDYTDEAQQALVFAARLFGDALITLIHAYSLPYSSLLDGTPEARDWTHGQHRKLHRHIDTAADSSERKASIFGRVEEGPPGPVLRRYVLEQGADLTVIGAHPRGVIFDAVVGNSVRIINAIPGDILMVRAIRNT